MFEQIVRVLEFINNWSNLGLIIVGTFALVVYILQKRDQIKTAATLLKSQIDDIERIVKDLRNYDRLENATIYNLPVILPANYWEEYRRYRWLQYFKRILPAGRTIRKIQSRHL